jgi:hypothetical protein
MRTAAPNRILNIGLLVVSIGGWQFAALPAGAVPIPIVLHSVTLKAKTIPPMLPDGFLKVGALLNDSDETSFATQALAGDVSITVTDGTGGFDTTVSFPFGECVQRRTGTPTRLGSTITCKHTHALATFAPLRSGPFVYRMTLRVDHLDEPDTSGNCFLVSCVQPTAPVTVTLHQGAIDRPDDISACALKARTYWLRCAE